MKTKKVKEEENWYEIGRKLIKTIESEYNGASLCQTPYDQANKFVLLKLFYISQEEEEVKEEDIGDKDKEEEEEKGGEVEAEREEEVEGGEVEEGEVGERKKKTPLFQGHYIAN